MLLTQNDAVKELELIVLNERQTGDVQLQRLVQSSLPSDCSRFALLSYQHCLELKNQHMRL